MSEIYTDQGATDLLAFTTQVVSAYVSHNLVEPDGLVSLVHKVAAAFSALKNQNLSLSQERPDPAVPISKSVKPGYIVCLEDGKKLKMLKRHLKTAYNMTPEEYKDRWGLSGDYPMVAPEYAKKRSHLAKTIGLGKRKG